MEQLALVLVTVYADKSMNTQSMTKQELPKDPAEQNSAYQIVSLKIEIDEKLFAKAVSLVGKTFLCPQVKLSKLRTLSLDSIETGVLLPI